MIDRPRVFLTVDLQQGAAYLANLSTFGELTYIYTSIPDFWSPLIEGDLLAAFEDEKFDASLDYFAVSGIMPLACMSLAVLVEEYGAVKTLLWDREKHIYREKEIGGLV